MADSSPRLPKFIISARAASRLRDGHVWVYESDITGKPKAATPGALVQVVDHREKPLGSALYSSSSQIALRMMTREQPLLSEDELMRLLRQRLEEAVAYRERVVRDANAWRVVFSEGDRLPGLIVDRYNDVYTLQVLTQAWDKAERKQAIVGHLRELTGAEHIVERAGARIRELEQLPEMASAQILGSKSATVFQLNGVQFHADVLGGQKTGGFLDQRENYAAAARYARGQALDVCTYQGGFALHLARTCDHVTAIDISREALEIAEQNEGLNRASDKNEIEWMEANAFDLLKDYAGAGKQYDIIVLDPPAFTRSKRNLEAAIRGYKELNLRALKMLKPGGVLVTCSCSFHVSEADFLDVLNAAAQDAHRSVRILEKRTQSQDHPVLLGVPETFYLKCVILSAS
jgi:23S rRNA (cytosine1962-C5)-methyltransferase